MAGSKIHPVKLVFAAVDRVTATVTRINERLEAMQAPVKRLHKQFAKLGDVSGFNRVNEAVGRVAQSVFALGERALFLGAALGGIALESMRRFIGHLKEVEDGAKVAGTSVEFLQKARFAATRAGVPEGALDLALRRLSVSLGKTKLGTGELFKVLKKIDPQFLRQLRSVKSNEEGFTLLMHRLKNVPNAIARNTVLVAALGRSGALLAPLVDEFDDFMTKAEELGLVLSADVIKQGDKAAGSLVDLTGNVTGLAFRIGTALLPTVARIVNQINDWFSANRPLINQKVTEFAMKLGAAIEAIADAIPPTLKWIMETVDTLGGFKTVLLVAAAVIGGPLIAALGLLSVALLTTPFGIVVTAISGLIVLTGLLYRNWDQVTASVNRFSAAIRSTPGFSWFNQETRFPAAERALDWAFPAAGAGASGGASRSEVGGNITLQIQGAPAKVKSLESWGIDLSVLTGLSMSGNF
jgi:hypothetical protein